MGCETVSLADIAVLIPGFSFKSKEFGSGFARAIKIGNISRGINSCDLPIVDTSKYAVGKLGKYQCVRGDYLVAMTGNTIGKIGRMLTGTAYANQRVLKVSGTDKVEPGFLWAALCTTGFHSHVLSHVDSHSAQPNISAKSIGEFKVELPDLATQKRISSVFMSIEEKIEVNNRLNGYLEELCDALFLDFLEQADSSWHEGTLEELAEVKYGKDHKKLADGPYPVYGSGGFMRSAEKSLFSGESVLIPRKGSLNNVMYVNEAFWTVDTMFFTVPRIPGAAKFLYQYVKRLDLASMNSGSAVPSMTTSILNALSLPVPPRDSLLSFNAKLQSMYDAVRANNLENRRLESLRDSLLPKLMTGEIDVSKIDLTQLNGHLA